MANINENEKRCQSQCRMIAAYLMQGKRINRLQAFRLFGCMELPARIFNLKERGMNIKSEMVTWPSGKRGAEYWLEK